jgi:hypothetical protein
MLADGKLRVEPVPKAAKNVTLYTVLATLILFHGIKSRELFDNILIVGTISR